MVSAVLRLAFFTVTLPDEPAADGFVHTLLIRRGVTDPTRSDISIRDDSGCVVRYD